MGVLYINSWLTLQALLFAGGIYWCYEVLGRWRDDVSEMRDDEDGSRRIAIVIIWIITAFIGALVIYLGWGLIFAIIDGIKSFL